MQDQINKFIIDTFMFGKGELNNDTPLFTSEIIDSLGFIRLLTFIENTFKISIDMSEISMDSFNTINDILTIINNKKTSSEN